MTRVMYVWPCGTWCWGENLHEYDWMSDDYRPVVVGEGTSDEIADTIAHLLTS